MWIAVHFSKGEVILDQGSMGDYFANDIEVIVDCPETIHQKHEVKQSVDDSVSSAHDECIKLLQSEIETLKITNPQLNDKCMKLEFDKQYAEKQARTLHKQLEELSQVLNKFNKMMIYI